MCSVLKFLSDIECDLYIDQKRCAYLKVGEILKYEIRKGVYLIDFKVGDINLFSDEFTINSDNEEYLYRFDYIARNSSSIIRYKTTGKTQLAPSSSIYAATDFLRSIPNSEDCDDVLWISGFLPIIFHQCNEKGEGYIVSGSPITTIDSFLFSSCKNLVKVILPETVSSIGECAFCGCENLVQIDLPDALTTIAEDAFCGCKNLTQIVIPSNVISIGKSAFRGCPNLQFYGSLASEDHQCLILNKSLLSFSANGCQEYRIPEYVTTIVSDAFADSGLESIILPDSLESVSPYAFLGCDNLRFYGKNTSNDHRCIIIEGKLCTISFDSLDQYVIPSVVKSIGHSAFFGCKTLRNVVFPTQLLEIEEYAFYGCDELGRVTIPDSVLKIGEAAFGKCHKSQFYGKFASSDHCCLIVDGVLNSFACGPTTEYLIPGGVTVIGPSSFRGSSQLEKLIIPEGVKEIAPYAFGECNNLSHVNLPSSLTKIEEYAFLCCFKLKTIILPMGLRSLVSNAISSCDNIYSESSRPPKLVGYLRKNSMVFVRSASHLSYRTADGWKKYYYNIFVWEF